MNKRLLEIFLDSGKVSIDSRNIPSGCMFFAIKGDKFNGNEFALEALEKGASFAIIDDKSYFVENEKRLILVDNSLKALQNLAHDYRKSLNTTVIGITGTNGKTTSKELINVVLSKKFNTFCTQGNYNNHIGVPLSLLSISKTCDYAIIEMGANHKREIHDLCQIADPDFGIITNIGTAHLEGFGSVENILKTKSELFDHVFEKEGLCFLNSDDPLLKDKFINSNVFTFGCGKHNNVVGILDRKNFLVSVRILFEGKEVNLESNLFGDFNFSNILGAVSIGIYFGVPIESISEAIEEYIPSNNRSQITRMGSTVFIMDAYNANPSSMNAAIRSFSTLVADRKFFILGDMLELGANSHSEHLNIVELLGKLNLTEGVLVGKEFGEISNGFLSVKTFEALKEIFKTFDFNNTVVLVKGSRMVGLERVLGLMK